MPGFGRGHRIAWSGSARRRGAPADAAVPLRGRGRSDRRHTRLRTLARRLNAGIPRPKPPLAFAKVIGSLTPTALSAAASPHVSESLLLAVDVSLAGSFFHWQMFHRREIRTDWRGGGANEQSFLRLRTVNRLIYSQIELTLFKLLLSTISLAFLSTCICFCGPGSRHSSDLVSAVAAGLVRRGLRNTLRFSSLRFLHISTLCALAGRK